MTATIWKFPLPIGDLVTIPMPKGACVLTVGTVRDVPCLWARVDTDAPVVERRFAVRGTGQDLGEVGAYIGTFTMYGDSLVFHVFDAVTAHEAF